MCFATFGAFGIPAKTRLAPSSLVRHLVLSRAPYVSYGVEYIDLVSLHSSLTFRAIPAMTRLVPSRQMVKLPLLHDALMRGALMHATFSVPASSSAPPLGRTTARQAVTRKPPLVVMPVVVTMPLVTVPPVAMPLVGKHNCTPGGHTLAALITMPVVAMPLDAMP